HGALLHLEPDNPHKFKPQRSPQDENLFFIEEAEDHFSDRYPVTPEFFLGCMAIALWLLMAVCMVFFVVGIGRF
ncbi:hypothetical protein, partial [Serratia marcescens]|uniref:hypothetical protein n=4 Tax=Enterobacterales TaxID=91347 RepID=UPI0027E589F4